MSEKNIWIAAGEGDLPRVRHLVEQDKLSPTVPDEFTYTPLHAAASYGHTHVLQYLLNHPSCPADAVNIMDDDGETPLFVVETPSVAQVLLDMGADPEHKNLEGRTALDMAVENGHLAVAELLASKTGVSLSLSTANEEDEEGERIARDLESAQTSDANSGTHPNGSTAAVINTHGTSGPAPTSNPGSNSDGTEERSEALYAAVEQIMQGAEQRFRTAHPDAPADAPTELTPAEEERLKDLVGASVVSQILVGWTQGQSRGENQT